MPAIPATDQKLQEARYYLELLSDSEDAAVQRRHLSAFLAAARSITFALQSEAKTEYDTWFSAWFETLTPEDRRLMNFMKEQRNAELKRAGAAVSATVEERSVWQRKNSGPNTPIAAALLALNEYGSNATVGVPALVFEVDGTSKRASDLCAGYVALLGALVADFKRAFP
jgi:hypothetical protein